MENPSFFLFAGEPSGDLHGSHLIKELLHIYPHANISGVGGPKMRIHGLQGPFIMEDFSVMGFIDVLKNLPKLIRQFHRVKMAILESQPMAVILIDYPDFNLRLAKALRKEGYEGKIIQYVSPSVWAWRRGRIETMEKTLDLLLTIYPFEQNYYEASSLPVQFVGNPLSEYLQSHLYQNDWKEKLGIPVDLPLLALFPGSRHGEIRRNLPIQLEAIRLLLDRRDSPCAVAISYTDDEGFATIEEELSNMQWPKEKWPYFIPSGFTYELMRDCRTALAKSGTVTLELALHTTPTVVQYKLSKLNYLIAKFLLRLNLPHYCIVNILANKEIYPEIIEGITAQDVSRHLENIDTDGPNRSSCIAGCEQVSSLFNDKTPSRSAAEAIASVIP